MPGFSIVIADGDEIRKIAAEYIRNKIVPGTRIIRIIEVALMQDEISPFVPNQPQNLPGTCGQPLVSYESNLYRFQRFWSLYLGLADRYTGHTGSADYDRHPSC